jgi:hypothetical protein
MTALVAAIRPHLCALACATVAAAVSGCTYYQVAPAAPAPGPTVFDRSWNAALGALDDADVAVTLADRASGTIYGTAGNDAVTMRVLSQADGSVRVETNVRGPSGADAALAQRIAAAYNRRMGR